MDGEDCEELIGFSDAVDRTAPREYCDDWDKDDKPSSLLYVEDLIRMRGLLVTQAAELEVGLHVLLSLVTAVLAKSPRAAHIKPRPSKQLTGLGSVLSEVIRLLDKACAAGLLRPDEVAGLRLTELGVARDIRNDAAHRAIKTDYAHDGIEWQPIWSWFGDEADVYGSDLAPRLAQLRDATVLTAKAYWQLVKLAEPPSAELDQKPDSGRIDQR